MFTKIKNPQISYVSRFAVLLFLLITCFAFSMETKVALNATLPIHLAPLSNGFISALQDTLPTKGNSKQKTVLTHTAVVTNDPDPIKNNNEIEPQFPGGMDGWGKFLKQHLKMDVPISKKAPVGTYITEVVFLVNKEGAISEVKPTTKHGYGMEEEVVRILKLSPKWIPAQQNGRVVNAYKKQKVTFVFSA